MHFEISMHHCTLTKRNNHVQPICSHVQCAQMPMWYVCHVLATFQEANKHMSTNSSSTPSKNKKLAVTQLFLLFLQLSTNPSYIWKILSLQKIQQWRKITVVVVTQGEREISELRYFFYYASLTHTLQGTLFIYIWIDKTSLLTDSFLTNS